MTYKRGVCQLELQPHHPLDQVTTTFRHVCQNPSFHHRRDRYACLVVCYYPYLKFISPPGYIAGSVLDRLLRHPTFATSEITVLIRKADKVPVFESLGVRTVLGSYDHHALLEKQASLSDVIFACVRVSIELA